MPNDNSRLPVCVLLATTVAIGFLLAMVTLMVAFPGFEDWLDAIFFGDAFIAMIFLMPSVFAAVFLLALYGRFVKEPAEDTLTKYATAAIYAVLVGAGGTFVVWLMAYFLI